MAIYREHLAAYRKGAAELVLLHGWASDSSIWRPLLAVLRRDFHITLIDLPGCGRSDSSAVGGEPDRYIDAILPLLPVHAIYCGWSLGGMLATRLAARFPSRVQALICVASNAVFVADDDWSAAMPAKDFERFAGLVATKPAAALRRFELLQLHGDDCAERVRSELVYRAAEPVHANLSASLTCLQALDNRQALAELVCPCLYLFGGADALVPSTAVAAFAECYPQHASQQIRGRGHFLFLADDGAFCASLLSFCRGLGLIAIDAPAQRNKSDIGRSFSLAAESYDDAALLQRSVADQLLKFLPSHIEGAVVDLGCGTGYSLPAIRSISGVDALFAVDLAEGMLQYAKQRYQDFNGCFLCGDAEDLPFADASVAHIFSSLALQWCENLPALFSEIQRVLAPNGSAVIATLGPQTLVELRAAWQGIDDYVHVNEFASKRDLHDAIECSGLSVASWREDKEVVYYERLSGLTGDLKGIGARNMNAGRSVGLAGRGSVQKLSANYERFRCANGKLAATYQVWYIQLNGKPVSSPK
jgi:malonyl-CoA O-methyltransferase